MSLDMFGLLFILGNAALISEALRHYQRLENDERLIDKSTTRKSDKQRRHYHLKECRIRPILIQQAVTHKIKVCPANHRLSL